MKNISGVCICKFINLPDFRRRMHAYKQLRKGENAQAEALITVWWKKVDRVNWKNKLEVGIR